MLDISKREKKVVISGIVFLVLFLGLQLIIAPAFERKENLNRILLEKQAALEDMVNQQKQIFEISSQSKSKTRLLNDRAKNFSLFSFLDSQVQQSGVKENVVYMKPFTKELKDSYYSLAIVKIKLTDVYLKELADLLFRIETSKNSLSITSLSISKTGKKKNRLDAIIETETLIEKDKV